jgi:hypothetical protein
MEYQYLIALVYILSFAIQQFIQMFDLIWDLAVTFIKEKIFKNVPEANIKKSLLMVISFAIGLILVNIFDIRLLKFIPDGNGYFNKYNCVVDAIVSALVLGSGTEAVNILLKYFGYVKDARKENVQSGVEIKINPPSKKLSVNNKFKFYCDLKNTGDTKQEIDWEVMDLSNGGTIDSDGTYTAPGIAIKDVTILARLKSNQSVYSTATVEVT